ncbi:8502_t:CDS:1, partial [Racocetra fulgida]
MSITLNATHSSAKDAIDALVGKAPDPCEVCILLASRTYSPKELEFFPSYIFTKLRPRVLVGCVVDKVYTSSDSTEFGHGISLFLGGWGKKEGMPNSWKFDEFCANVQGSRREYKTNSVGR